MRSYLLTRRARLDYFDAFEFISGYSPQAADRWQARILRTFDHLAEWPETGTVRAELAPSSLRFWVDGDYLILYYSSVDPIEIIAILHGAQDLSDLIATRLLKPDLEDD